jgi:outer membrane protein assembly factor BamB
LKRATCIFSMAIIILAILSAPPVRSQQTETSYSLGIKPLLARKDTYMLDLQYPLTGPDAWDVPHNNTGIDDDKRGMVASVAMVASYYGGNLSQDRIRYYVYHQLLHYPSPQDDLGDGSGIIPDYTVPTLLSWALNNASIGRVQGKPGFSEITDWIDSRIPIIRDGGGTNHLITVIDGYNTDGQMVNVLDPLAGNESEVPYDSLDVFCVWIPTGGGHITARSDEPTIWMDSDYDGVVDFDEINRFHTNPYNNDTYGLGISDKMYIEYKYKDNLTFPTATFKHSPDTPQVNEQVTFDASGNTGNITAYTWKFGDGNVTTVTAPTIDHAYKRSGTYNVTLRVNDTNGMWNITRSSLTVIVPNSNDSAFYRQSLDRKGYASTVGPETPDLLWASSLNGSITTSPVVIDGKVFIGTSGGTFYALDMATGDTVWTLDAGSSISSSPAFQNGVVFFGTESPGTIYAVDAQTGHVRWLYPVPTGAGVDSSPAVVNGSVIVGCSDGELLCLNQYSGQLLWTTQLGGGSLSSPAIQNGTVFIASSLGVNAVNMLTGASIWEYTTKWPVTSCPSVADGLVFVGTDNDDHVYALNQSTGKLVWGYWTSGWLTTPAVDSSKQLVIVGCKDYSLICLDEQTGLLEWQYLTTRYLYPSAPTISVNGLVYIGTPDGSLICVNETTGEETWQYNVTTSVVSSPSIDYEHVFVGTLGGEIYCFGSPFPVNNITVSKLTVSKSVVGKGYSLQMNATVDNDGGSEETLNVTAYANGTAIATKEVTMMNGTSTTITFTWNTTGFAYGNYTISAYAWPVPGETNLANNNCTGGTVKVTIPGDANGDGKVDAQDFFILERAWGTSIGQPNYDPRADFNGDGVVDAQDLFIMEYHWGQSVAL